MHTAFVNNKPPAPWDALVTYSGLPLNPDSPGPIAHRLDNEGDKKLRIPVPWCPFSLATLQPLEGTGS
jgi:hypothetical protein